MAVFTKLRQSEIESFFVRLTGSHTSALFLREVTYWFMPSSSDEERPRAPLYRDGFYWFGRLQRTWLELHELGPEQLKNAYRRSAEILVVDHFMFEGKRTSYYRLDFDKLQLLLQRDQKLQLLLEAKNAARRRLDARSARGERGFSRNTRKEGNKLPSPLADHVAYPGEAQP